MNKPWHCAHHTLSLIELLFAGHPANAELMTDAISMVPHENMALPYERTLKLAKSVRNTSGLFKKRTIMPHRY
jgi:hypothetical protein